MKTFALPEIPLPHPFPEKFFPRRNWKAGHDGGKEEHNLDKKLSAFNTTFAARR